MTKRSSADILTDAPPPDADVRVVYGPGPLQFGDLRLPPGGGPHPVAIVVHGGYWQSIYNLVHAGHLCVDLAARGIATWNVEYRRLGDPGGGWPGTFEDVLRAFDHLPRLAATYPLDLDRVAAVGHSAGGHLALLAAGRTSVQLRGAVSLAGVVDLHMLDAMGADRGLARRLLGGGPDDVPERWREASPRQHLPWPLRTILVCGTEDVHWRPNEAVAAAAQEAGGDVELVALPGAGHFELVDPAAAEWEIVRAQLEAVLA
ncbi:MAG TPA: alpha/beta hydrolase [Gaiella sp.]